MLVLDHISKTFNPGTITEKRALKDISLTINDGDFITVIGGNGAGKSTLLNLIAGVFLSDTGSIKLDGEDITEQKEHVRAKYLGRVFQDPMRGTAGTMEIEENLALAYRRGKKRGLGWGVCEKERDFYRQQLALLDLGLETRMNAKVGLLSGGQRQRVSIARAILKNPPILILDEATSALDTESERLVQEALERLMKSRTTIAIAHRLSTIKNADEIYVMKEGEIVERGTHDELLARDGYYKKLTEMQNVN